MEEKKPATLGEYFRMKEEKEKEGEGRTLIDLLMEALKSKEEKSKPKLVEAGIE